MIKAESVLNAAPDAMVIVDEKGAIVLANRQTEKLFACDHEELIGKPVEALIPGFRGADLVHRSHSFQAADAHPPGADLTLQALRKDGEEVPVEISLSPLETDQGTLVIAAVRDVTGRRAAQTTAEDAQTTAVDARRTAEHGQRKAEEANRIKDDFLATLSHELRTPLNAILGWSTILASGHLSIEASSRAVQSVIRCARQQTRLVDDLLDVSRIVSGSLHLTVQSLALAPVVEAAIDTVRLGAEAKFIQLQVVLDSSEVVVAGDHARLQQIVWNLLSNAVKYTPKGGRILVSLEYTNSVAQLTVKDSGRGIEPDFLPFVFDRFRQADSSSTRAIGGLGLGLAIVRQLVELHGGTVDVHSEGANLGATFTVRLPIRTVQTDSRHTTPARERDALDQGLPDDPPDLRGVTVLVVEDDDETCDLLKTLMILAGARAITAVSAVEALAVLAQKAVLAQNRPDIVICDIGLPVEDGYSLIRKIRSRSAAEGGRIPAVALTAFAQTEDRTRALRAGFQSHLAKPAEPTELLAVVAALVGRTGIS
jgi:PAS domain S-box-containing protein